MKNYNFDYVVPLEVLHKNHKKAYKEYCDKIQARRKKEERIKTIEVIIMLSVMILSIEFAFLTYFLK